MINDLRYETKFVLNEREFTQMLSWVNLVGAQKIFSSRTVNSIYYDNISKDGVQNNLSGVPLRHKIRLRWYGDNIKNFSDPKLEIKLREGRLGSKIHYPVSINASSFGKICLNKISKKIINEFESSNSMIHILKDHLTPMLLVKYDREYYKINNGVRITLDKNIKFYDLAQFTDFDSLKIISYPPYVVEFKYPKELKNNVINLLRTLHLTPKRHSKYVSGLAKLGYVQYI